MYRGPRVRVKPHISPLVTLNPAGLGVKSCIGAEVEINQKLPLNYKTSNIFNLPQIVTAAII